jgi:hypothetical protein
MPNPVAANDLQPISGSLQTSRISYGVETAGKNYGQNYNSTTWYSDIPNNGQFYTIISDNYTANYYNSRSLAEGAYVEGGLPAVDEYSAPVFWVTPGTSSLDVITIVNGLPDRVGQTPFNSGSQALNWIASSSNYFAVGPDYYEQIDADQLQLYLEANQIISYPTTGSTWYDLSGNGKNGILYNGPTFSAVSGAIIFDGTDDYVQGPIPIQNPSAATLEVWYNTTADEAFPGENRLLALGLTDAIPGATAPGISLRLRDDRVGFAARQADNSGYWDIFSGATVINGRWQHVIGTFDTTALKRYENGVLTEQTATGQNYLTASDGYSVGGATAFFDGKIAKARFYSKTLTQAEVLQNYYGGPIVTNGLVFALDINNLVSYPKSGTTIYDLTGTYSITATNSSYQVTPDGVPAWRFTGNNSRLNVVNYSVADSSNTYEGWFKINSIGTTEGKSNGWNTLFDSGTERPLIGFFNGVGYVYPQGYGGAFSITSGVWFHIAVVFVSDNDVTVFLNGQKVVANSNWGFIQRTGTFDFWIGGDTSTESMDGWVSNCRFYNRALTDSEVLQNYNATK